MDYKEIVDYHARTIVHIDIDCFYAQVEMNKNEELRNVPLGVQQKNYVITSNYIAREQGIKKCMFVSDALKLCPKLVLVNGEDLHDYRQISYRITSYLQKYSSLVERLGLDENFIDITDLVSVRLKTISGDINVYGHIFGNTEEVCYCGCIERLKMGSVIAQEIRESIKVELGLTCSAGIGHNKLLAKIVGAKHKPNQQTVLFPNSAQELLHSLNSISEIPGIGRTMDETLKNINVNTIDDIHNISYEMLKSVFGDDKAKLIKNLANGIDETVVKPSGRPQSIGIEDSCKNITAISEIKAKLNQLLNRLMILVSEDGRIPRTIKLTIRKLDNATKISARETRQCNITTSLFSVKIESITLPPKSEQKLMIIVMNLFHKLVNINKPYHITLLGLSFTKFLERMNGKSSISAFLRKNVEVQSVINIENKNELIGSPMDYTMLSSDLRSDGSESEYEPSPKKTKLTKLIAKRRCFSIDDCPSPSKLKVAELHLGTNSMSSDGASISNNNSNTCCPPNVDTEVFKELPRELQQELWDDYQSRMSNKQQILQPTKKKPNTLLNYFLKH